MKSKILLLSLFLLASSFASALIIHVPGNYNTIQLAINAANNGDTVLVEPGIYFENINFRGKKIVVTSRFYIGSNLSYIQSTIINGSTPVSPDSATCVRFHNGEDSTTVLQGFTITGGMGTKWTDEHGAGIYREGGGILIAFCSPIIKNNIIINNEAINTSGVTSCGGGGLRIGDGNPKILNNIIMDNKGLYGAGIVLNYTGVTVKNNLICYNSQSTSYQSGAGIWANSTLSGKIRLIENNTIIHNSSTSGTAGVLSYSSILVLKNNIVWGNTTPLNGPQVLAYGGGTLTATYCDIQGGYSGAGNINIYPQFADTNFILANGSPCIDEGDSSAVYNDPVDSANPVNARFPSKGGLRNDLGAYGGAGSFLLSNNMVIGINENDKILPEGYRLYQNYPNPFNPITKIKFDIPLRSQRASVEVGVGGMITLKIYDILGKEIAKLLDRQLSAGSYEISWDATDFPSGAYFFKLSASDYTETKTMLLIK